MRCLIIGAAAALVACSGGESQEEPSAPPPDIPQPSGPPIAGREPASAPAPAPVPGPVWESVVGDDGTALRLAGADGRLRMSIACLADPPRLAVNVPDFEPVMSEDRFAFGLGNEPVTLVADPYRQEARPGVTGEAPVPDDFAALVEEAATVSALYGAQRIGPFPAPGAGLKRFLIDACRGDGD